jgi:hypothetical protein
VGIIEIHVARVACGVWCVACGVWCVMQAVVLLVPAFVIIGLAESVTQLYIGFILFSIGQLLCSALFISVTKLTITYVCHYFLCEANLALSLLCV